MAAKKVMDARSTRDPISKTEKNQRKKLTWAEAMQMRIKEKTGR